MILASCSAEKPSVAARRSFGEVEIGREGVRSRGREEGEVAEMSFSSWEG